MPIVSVVLLVKYFQTPRVADGKFPWMLTTTIAMNALSFAVTVVAAGISFARGFPTYY
jgi:hypothetical protein